MKLHKVLAINSVPVVMVKDDVRLDMKSPGRATFTIQSPAPVKGLVTLDIGYNEAPLQRHFIGYVERCSAANSIEQVLFCRELAAILANPLPLNLRHVDLRAILGAISEQTGLRFRVPEQPYASVRAPFFYSLAAGYQAMDSLGRVFNIPDFIWQQQGNGEVFVGSWADSFSVPGRRCSCRLNCLTATRATSAMVAALPGLRPGATINQGERVTSVTLSDNQMGIRWKTQSAAL